MQKYIATINSLIEQCDKLTKDILSDELNADFINGFVNSMSNFLQVINQIYSMPQYADHAADLPAWVEQIKRFVGALQGGDTFFLLDVVGYELKENLREVLAVIGGVA